MAKKAEEPKSNRGGKRPGAGRKPGEHGPKVQVTSWLSEEVREWLENQGQATGLTIEAMIRKSSAFRKQTKS